MKKHLFFICAILLLYCNNSFAQDSDLEDDESTTYFTIEEMPDLLKWLPAPPDTLSEGFTHDIMRYMWGKTQRLDPERAEIAIRDAVYGVACICQEFSEPFGLKLSKEDTPEIYNLLIKATATMDLICANPKAFYMRKRPFMRMNEPSLTPDDELTLSLNGSYPSGHTILGWGSALLLMEINPAAADTLLARGMMYGDSRIIVGAHWQSDVDAGRLAASAAYAKLHTSPEFMEQMAKAQAEFRRLTSSDSVEPIPAEVYKKEASLYDIQGRRLTKEPDSGIYLQGNKKRVVEK